MLFAIFLSYVFTLVIVSYTDAQSPCPSVYEYRRDTGERSSGEWKGILNIPTAILGWPLKVEVNMFLAYALPKHISVGSLRLIGDSNTISHQIARKQSQSVILEQTFPFHVWPIPFIDTIVVNNVTICRGPIVHSANKLHVERTFQSSNASYSQGNSIDWETSKPKAMTTNQRERSHPMTYKANAGPRQTATEHEGECGYPVKPVRLIAHGTPTEIGDWPWVVAIKTVTKCPPECECDLKIKFMCGGSLITMKHVISAAHCFQDTNGERKVIEEYVLELGKYDITKPAERHSERREVSYIQTHPNFDYATITNDIAVVTMDRPVTYTARIRPICLWPTAAADLDHVVGKIGTVVGWGLDEHQTLTLSMPAMARVPIVSQELCTNSLIGSYVNENTLCAGFKNGTGPCTGDSGGGLVLPYAGSRDRKWYLRGVVSLSAGHRVNVCNLYEYVIYTDVEKYQTWINGIIGRSVRNRNWNWNRYRKK